MKHSMYSILSTPLAQYRISTLLAQCRISTLLAQCRVSTLLRHTSGSGQGGWVSRHMV